MKRPKILYAVLDMGLGHASRSLPIIRKFVDLGCQVSIASKGRALSFLKSELPELQFFDAPGYDIEYSHSQFLIPKLLQQLPKILRRIKKENNFCKQIVNSISPDFILSDHCYGIYHEKIPSYFITHQVFFAVPFDIPFISNLISLFNLNTHRNFRKVFIPDFPDEQGGVLSGHLSKTPRNSSRYKYVGILSSLSKMRVNATADVFISISGPEPQRTIFEEKVLSQVDEISGRKIVILGKSELEIKVTEKNNLSVFTHLSRAQVQKFMNKSDLIISRPGYSTIMELVELGKKALFVPTPGQTEQAYLSKRMQRAGCFYSVVQNRIDLGKDVEKAKSFPGFYRSGETVKSVNSIMEEVFC
jgi:uncharacterized protein (TIGR00661 family)